MPWTYSVSRHELRHDGQLVDNHLYSGAGASRDNPNAEDRHDEGPIPRGRYSIGQATTTRGPLTITLTPVGHNARNRTNFRIHGERVQGPPGNASTGCIIADHRTRAMIMQSPGRLLDVVQ